MKKTVKILAIVLIIGGISISFIHLGFFRDFVKNKFCQYLEKKYALTTKIERLDYNLFKPSFRLVKLELKYQDTRLFFADEIYVEPSYKIYFGNINVFRKISIRNPHVNIIKSDKGFLLPNIGESQKEQHPASFRVRNLEIIGGQIKLEDQDNCCCVEHEWVGCGCAA